jgi:hypothetical protein
LRFSWASGGKRVCREEDPHLQNFWGYARRQIQPKELYVSNSSFQVRFVKMKPPEGDGLMSGTETYCTMILLGDIPLGLFKEVAIEVDGPTGLPLLKMTRVLYGHDLIKTVTEEELYQEFPNLQSKTIASFTKKDPDLL